ncbi:gp53-like domain-containing protein [Sphingopyxis yananensis]|uniref:gp53-like domain-containing protein n=1 Tax=Sphingopyxis yananensis TaxID=2886687 RepID=UPI001D12B5BC|nr:hypothetical protein [Sphingopyxis yananensis]MCC2603022.1 hypothetical protein [Sphingopyxis yananensis]
MAVQIIITNAGRAALINAANTGTNPVQITQVGLSATAIVPTPAMTSLTGETKRLSTMSGDVVADDVIHLTVRDESNQSYSVRSFGLYLADGTLFAIYGQAALLVQKSAQSIMLLAVDVKFADIAAADLTFGNADFLLPPATETVQGVIEIATQPEANTGVDDQRALTAKKARAALMTWLLALDGAGSGLDADLLDGQHATDFLQASLFTGTQILSRLIAVDGAGSGLDADLLDGQHASDFLQASLFTGAQILSRLIAVDGAGSGLDADLLDGQHASDFLPASLFTSAQILSRLLTVDGAGSGLDADLLDGQDGSYYANVIARLGFTPLNATVYTPADVFAKVLGLDGAGSGLDADLLDGYQATAFLQASLFTGAQIISRLGYTPLNTTAYTAADVLAKALTVDGSGSGLDADLLDGRHASDFALLSGWEYGSNANGYWRKSPDGVIEQWGSFTGNFAEGAQIRNFPIAFTDLNSVMMQSNTMNTAGTNNNDIWTQSGLISLTQFRVVFQATSSGNYGSGARWYAIGK